jgi:hypothetical protein
VHEDQAVGGERAGYDADGPDEVRRAAARGGPPRGPRRAGAAGAAPVPTPPPATAGPGSGDDDDDDGGAGGSDDGEGDGDD